MEGSAAGLSQPVTRTLAATPLARAPAPPRLENSNESWEQRPKSVPSLESGTDWQLEHVSRWRLGIAVRVTSIEVVTLSKCIPYVGRVTNIDAGSLAAATA